MAIAPAPAPTSSRPRDSWRSWPIADRIGFVACWAAGIFLCVVAATIVIFMLVKGLQFVRPGLLFESPVASLDQSATGGFLDPIIGTVMLLLIGIAIAGPLGVVVAVWLVEYGRPGWLARAVESGVEIIAGTPSIVLALFGLLLFQSEALGFLSLQSEGAGALGRSFVAAGAMMSLIALPLVVGATREALQAVPNHVREASYALGKSRAATIRRVLLPAIRPGIATGSVLGMGRIAGDTAIVVILLGATLQIQPLEDRVPILDVLTGTGSTLTSYVYNNSPVGEGNAPEKAYAAAFVLLLIVVALNALVGRIARGSKEAPSWIR